MSETEIARFDELLKHLATREDLVNLELRLTQRIMETERSLRNSVDSTRNLIFGTYALMLAAIFINHFWK